jgi:Protein of unknown function (DUF2975)
MNPPRNDLLLLIGKVLTLVIQGVMGLSVAVITLCIPAVALFQGSINADSIVEFGPNAVPIPALSVIALLACALLVVVLVFLFFGKLRGIIDTVAAGDPFVPDNADRLSVMAWLQIGIYLASLATAGAAAHLGSWLSQYTDVKVDASVDVDVPSILLVIILFILARVFRHGAAMREDLEGTV